MTSQHSWRLTPDEAIWEDRKSQELQGAHYSDKYSPDMKVLPAENGHLKEWDDYVNVHPDACVFHTSAWRRVVESTYGHQPFYLMAKRGSQITGVLPMFLIKSCLFGRVLATTPYASSGAVCSDDQESGQILVESAIQLARELQVAYLELKSTSLTECAYLERHADYINYHLPLDEPDILWAKRLKGRARTALRKADSFHLTCSQGHQLLDVFHHLMAINMCRLGTPVHSRSFYQAILSFFDAKACIFVAKYQQVPVSTLLTLHHGHGVTVLYASSLVEYRHMNPNNYLYWGAMKAAYYSGATSFDFGRSLAGSGPAKFKESWGAEAKPLYYEYFLNRQKAIPRIRQDNPSYQIARSVWKRLPLNITKLVGPHLIKNVP